MATHTSIIRLLFLIRHLYIWVVCGHVWLQEWISVRDVANIDWIVCSNYDNHSKLNGQHVFLFFIWGPNDHLMSMRIFAFNNERDIDISFENYEESGFGIDLANHVFHILWEVG